MRIEVFADAGSDAFDRVVKTGKPNLVLVSGYSGVGKSSVVNELRKVAVCGIATDITGRKRAEDALHEAQTELSRVSRLTTMEQLAASIAHEVNQPLAAVVTSGNACCRRITPALAEGSA